jgi:hypothetical protein
MGLFDFSASGDRISLTMTKDGLRARPEPVGLPRKPADGHWRQPCSAAVERAAVKEEPIFWRIGGFHCYPT